MQAVLEQLSRVRGVGGCMLLSPDGLPMAAVTRDAVAQDAMSAVLATLVKSGQTLAGRMDLGKPKLLHALSAQGGIILMAAGPSYLAILADPNANLALLQLEAKPFVEAIAQQLSI